MKQYALTCLILSLSLVGLSACSSEKSTSAAASDVSEPMAEVAEATSSKAKAETSEKTASDGDADNPEAVITAQITENLPQLKISSITESVVPGMYRVALEGGEAIHTTADGKHIFNGDLLAIKKGGVDNLTEAWRGEQRVEALKKLDDKDMVVFPAKGEEKGVIYAFTDTSCGYCQKMHQEMDELNTLGLTIKYVAWPRYGLQSDAGQLMTDIWCSKDRQTAMTLAKSRQPVPKPEGECSQKTVILDQIALGQTLGIRGTPALFLADGRRVGGYRPAKDLAAEVAGNTTATP